VLIPILVLLPGYALLPVDFPRRLRLPFVLFVSVAVTSVAALLLVAIGQFNVVVLNLLEMPLILLRVRSRRWPNLALSAHSWLLVVAAAVGIFAVMTAGEPFDAHGDAGVYTISALHLEQSGRWTWPLQEVIPADVDRGLVIYRPRLVQPWWEVAPGFIVRGERVVPQFFPLYPVWGAIFATAFGIRGVLAANVLGAFLMLAGLGALARMLLGRRWDGLAVAAVALNPIFLIFLKYPSAEIFLGGLLAGWLVWMVLYLRAPSARSAWLPGVLLALAILTKFFAWAVAGAAMLALLLLRRRHLLSAAGFVAMLVPAFVADLVVATPHLENHLGQLMVLSGFKLVAAASVAIVLLRLIWPKVRRSAPPVFGMLFGAALVVLWFRAEPGHLRAYAALSGSAVVWGAVLGLMISTVRRRSLWLVFPGFVFALLSLYLFLGSGDSPYYPFAARRYLPVTVPLGAFFLAWLGRWCAQRLARVPALAAPAPAAAVVVAAVVLAPAMWTQRSAVLVRQGAGFLETLAALEAALPLDRPVLATGNAWRYAPHLLLRGEPVFCLDLKRPGVLPRIRDFLARRPETVVLADERRTEGVLETIVERRDLIRTTMSPPLTAAPPRGSTFRLFAVDDPAPPVPGAIDVGSNDHLSVAGVYRAEMSKERSFRWTGNRASAIVGPARQIRFVWSRGANPKNPLWVRVFVAETLVGETSIGDGWVTSPWFDLPEASGHTVVEIRVPIFQPASIGRGHDRRLLGLRLDRIELR
jgi:hypothetical protein